VEWPFSCEADVEANALRRKPVLHRRRGRIELKLYIDLDGVLADFDSSAEAILRTDNIYKYEFVWGPDKFWERINKQPSFFRDLPLKADARHLWAKVSHLEPTILTALPRENGERVDTQKRAWVATYFGKGRPRSSPVTPRTSPSSVSGATS
jgi:hypothetical protein